MANKGISTIVATILMLAITTALGGTTYLYLSDFLTSKTQGLEIADVYQNTIIVRNIGTEEVSSLTDMKVDGASVTYTINPPLPIRPGQAATITVSTPISSGTHQILIASQSARARVSAYFGDGGAPPTCSYSTGTITFTPNPANPSSSVTAISSYGTACSGKSLQLRQDACTGTQVGSCTVDGTGTCTAAFTSPAAAGAYNYLLCEGATTTQHTGTLNVGGADATPPTTTASITGSYTIALTCSDTQSGCSQTKYCTDATNSCTPSTVYTAPFTQSCTGTCYVRYSSTDNANNQETTKSTSFGPGVVDTTPPVAGTYTINGQSTGPIYTSGSLAHAWSGFSDTGSGLYSFEIWRAAYNPANCKEGDVSGCSWTQYHVDTTNPATGSWTETINNHYMYGWHSSDKAGNWIKEPVPFRIVYDATSPTAGTISPTTATAGTATTFSAAVSDSIAVTSCSLYVSGSNAGSMSLSASPCTSCTASKSYTFASAGSYPVYAKCTDAAGNTAQGSSVTVTVTSTPSGKPNGASCSSGAECLSSYCVDGVCCNSACSGSTCQRCDSYSSAGAGTCGYVSSSSQDPDNECGTTDCYTGSCSGTGYSCGYKTSGEGGCPLCRTCNGATSGNCVNIAAGSKDTEGTYTCTGFHQACNGAGKCSLEYDYYYTSCADLNGGTLTQALCDSLCSCPNGLSGVQCEFKFAGLQGSCTCAESTKDGATCAWTQPPLPLSGVKGYRSYCMCYRYPA